MVRKVCEHCRHGDFEVRHNFVRRRCALSGKLVNPAMTSCALWEEYSYDYGEAEEEVRDVPAPNSEVGSGR